MSLTRRGGPKTFRRRWHCPYCQFTTPRLGRAVKHLVHPHMLPASVVMTQEQWRRP